MPHALHSVHKAIDWLLQRMVSKDYKDFISINIHLTPALQDNDLRACIARVRLSHARHPLEQCVNVTNIHAKSLCA